MKKVLDKLADMLGNVSGFLFFIIFAINMMEIISRTFFNHSFLWVSDISVICVVWMICLSISAGVYHKEHLVMEFLIEKMPPKVRKILSVSITLISLAFFIMLFYTGIQTAATKSSLIFPSIMWPQIWAYSALPTFAFFSAIFMIPRLIKLLEKGESPQKEAVV